MENSADREVFWWESPKIKGEETFDELSLGSEEKSTDSLKACQVSSSNFRYFDFQFVQNLKYSKI